MLKRIKPSVSMAVALVFLAWRPPMSRWIGNRRPGPMDGHDREADEGFLSHDCGTFTNK